jgi:NAD(P)-dependent dehydrogenase (short-subunit alcohol dehydrogenase family)
MNNGQKTDQQTAFPADQTLETNRRYTSRQLLAVFWPYLQPHRLRIALAILALVLVAGALLGMGRGLAYLVDEGLGKRDPALLDRAVMATAMIAVVLAFGSYLRTSMVNKIGEMVLADIRRAIFGHAITLSAGWFENARTGDVLSSHGSDNACKLQMHNAEQLRVNRNNYGAAKAGVAGFMRVLALEGMKYGITVNVLAPAALSRMTEDLMPESEETAVRMAPEKVSPTVAWLCTDAAAKVTGRQFCVSGNRTTLLSWQYDVLAEKDSMSEPWTVEAIGEQIEASMDNWPKLLKPMEV